MLFPRTIFADRNTIYRQWWHLFSEVLEVGIAIIRAQFTGNWYHVAKELTDVQCSADTGRFIVHERHGADVYGAEADVIIGNAKRGYYGEVKGDCNSQHF